MQSRGVYIIRVAAMLSGMHPQTLRKYERVGLLTPSRSRMLRMYSDEDIALLKMIKYLVDEVGLNLAGVDLALTMRSRLLDMKRGLVPLTEDSRLKQRLGKAIGEMLQMIEP
ncbi:MAG: MerR family transcriptional regulator [Dehalococcoidia bacterium]